jgi:hypothetical protein
MTGLLMALIYNNRHSEAAQLATECAELIESLGDPALIVALLPGPIMAKNQAGEVWVKGVSANPQVMAVITARDHRDRSASSRSSWRPDI